MRIKLAVALQNSPKMVVKRVWWLAIIRCQISETGPFTKKVKQHQHVKPAQILNILDYVVLVKFMKNLILDQISEKFVRSFDVNPVYVEILNQFYFQ